MYISKTLFTVFLTDDEIFHSTSGNKIVDIIKLDALLRVPRQSLY